MENSPVSQKFTKKLSKFLLQKVIKTCSQFNKNVSIQSTTEKIWSQEIWLDQERHLLSGYHWLSILEDTDFLDPEEFKPFVLLQLENLLSKSPMKLPSWSITIMNSNLSQYMVVSILRNRQDNWKTELTFSSEPQVESWTIWKEETLISLIWKQLF